MQKIFLNVLCAIFLLFSSTNSWSSIDLNGDGDYITSSDLIGESQSFTVLLWFFTDDDTSAKGLVSEDTGGAGRDWQLILTGGGIRIRVWDTGGSAADTGTIETVAIVADAWTQIGMSWNSSTEDIFYSINGVNTDSTLNQDTLRNGATLYGPGFAFSTSFTLNGKLSEVALWNTVLTSAEIALYYNSRGKRIPLQIQPANLLAYYPLDRENKSCPRDLRKGGKCC